jgi:GNAT superfamily N-acetyltransferase
LTDARVRTAETPEDIQRCFPVMLQLRPQLTADSFLEAVFLQIKEGYRLAYVESGGKVSAVAGFRVQHMLHRGKCVYVDDLVTDSAARSKGHGALLLDWLVQFAREQGCDRLDLDSGVQRFDAHRFYFRQRMHISAYHFHIDLK